MVTLQKKQHKSFTRFQTELSSEGSPLKHVVFDEHLESGNSYVSSTNKKWYEEFPEEPSEHAKLPQEKIDNLRIEAQKIMADEVTKYELKLSRTRSDHQWMRTVLSRGTTSDKIAVYTLLIQESPLYSLSSLESLVSMAKVAKKKECIEAIDTLTELFLSELLPLDRRLRVFETCPLTDSTSSDHPRLLRYYYENQLKTVYYSFVEALNATARDTVDANKEKAIVAIYKLLSGCPEQEAILLRNLVNKLGDPNAKVVSKVIYCLGQLLSTHPNMKAVVMDEIEKLLFRSNVSARAQYYCICFLSQFVFSGNDTSVAKNLIKLYFSFFKACIKKGEVDSRMMSVLLMGVNRAYPYAKAEMEQISEHVQTMYKVVHLASFNVSLHTLSLLYHVCDHANSMSDRFYGALYKKIADPGLMSSCHQAMFLSLVFRSLRKDTHAGRIRAFIKRLLQVCMYAPVPLACGILYMTSQLVYRRSDLLAVSCKASFLGDGDDDSDEHYDDVKLEESSPVDEGRQEEERRRPSESAEVEVVDVKEEVGDVKPATWLHGDNMRKTGGARGRMQYSPFQRNPTFAGAEHAAYVELLELSQHFHPTVALFASNIMQGILTNYSGDPLLDFTVSRFLDRFVFKNPKKTPRDDVPIHPFDRKKKYVPSGAKALRVNTSSYLNIEENNIPEDERFMYRYLYTRQKKTTKGEEDSDLESVASEEFEEMMDGLTGSKDDNHSLDFADHITKKSKSNDKKDTGGSDEESVQDEYNEDSDESFADDASDVVFDSDGNDNEEDIANELKDFQFGDDDDDDEGLSQTSPKAKKKWKKSKEDMRSMFASADEFAEILQDEGASGQSGEVSNKDNAGLKQLKWESARDFWLNRSDKKRNKQVPAGKAKKLRRK